MSSGKSERRQENLAFYRAMGERLKEIRVKLGLSQGDLVAEFGVGRSTISEWESGKYAPDIPFIVAFTNKHNVDLLWFLSGEFSLSEEKGKTMTVRDDDSEYKANSKLREVIDYLNINSELLDAVWHLVQAQKVIKKSMTGG